MYGIDINFLNDRADRPTDAIVPVRKTAANSASKLPLLVGLAVAIASCAGVGGYWLILQNQQKSLMAESSVLDSQLVELQAKLAQVDTVRQQTQAVEAEVQALASVFERIRPWSAIVRDIQGRIPGRTQISRLVQVAPAAPGDLATAPAAPAAAPAAGAPAASTSAAGGLELGGNACSFDDVNDFLLTLKSSPFLESKSVKITEASLGEIVPGRCPGEVENGSPLALVTYTITGDIKSIPATALLNELNRQQESTGLAARIRALQATGAIK
jgi:type IV pilus assembly protein PilN